MSNRFVLEVTNDPELVLKLAPKLYDDPINTNLLLPLLEHELAILKTAANSGQTPSLPNNPPQFIRSNRGNATTVLNLLYIYLFRVIVAVVAVVAVLRLYTIPKPKPKPNTTSHPPHLNHAQPLAVPNCWILLFTKLSDGTRRLDFVLSITSNDIGDYPLFIYSPLSRQSVTTELIKPRFNYLIDHLIKTQSIMSSRIFAVFARTELSVAFADLWCARTGAVRVTEPYYTAVLAKANQSSFNHSIVPEDGVFRPAEPGDLEDIARCCKEFADDSITYPMTIEAARLQAAKYIRSGVLYLCVVERGGNLHVASIVAVTRNTFPASAFITKVFTVPAFRGHRLAQKLVAWVCERYFELGYETISLYVDEQNKSAAHAYKKVGFQGIDVFPRPEGFDEWQEIGFEGAAKGFW